MEFPSVYPSVNPLVIKKYYYRGIYRWNEVDNFFYATDPSVNPAVIIFFYYQWIYRRIKNYRWKIHWRSIFIGDFVSKLITDGICVLRRQKNFIGKTVKCCSELACEVRFFLALINSPPNLLILVLNLNNIMIQNIFFFKFI